MNYICFVNRAILQMTKDMVEGSVNINHLKKAT
jgi:hypothetical protein